MSLHLKFGQLARAFPSSTITVTRCQSGAVAASAENLTPLSFSSIPGPKPLPFIGNGLELKKNLAHLRMYFQECFKKYGDIFRVKAVGQYNVVVKDPDTIEMVLRAEGKYPIRENLFTPNFVWLYENSLKETPTVSLLDGKRWKEVRTALGKQTMPRSVQAFHKSYNDIISRFSDYIASTRSEDGIIKDIDYPIRRLLIELAAITVYGSEMNAVANPSSEDKEFIEAVCRIFQLEAEVAVSLPLYKLYDNKLSKEFRRVFQILGNRTRIEVERLYADFEKGKQSEVPGVLEHWLREGKISAATAMHESKDLFGAAVDTTSNQAVFLLHALAANEDVQENLYKEIESVLGDHRLPQLEHFSKMPYMKGCLLESYRLFSTAPGTVRVLQEDLVLHGYQVPAGTTVTYALYTAGRDSSLFPDPLNFDPLRWQRDETHAFAIQPFGFGPRSCLGRRFAELELKILMIQMVRKFKMSTEIKDLDTEEKNIVYPKGDVTIKFMDRN